METEESTARKFSSQKLQLEIIWLEDSAELLIKMNRLEEASLKLESALMITQELEMAQKEAKICEKLGFIFYILSYHSYI